MNERDDRELLAEYTQGGSEAAFDVIVDRYVNLVYSAALRHTGNVGHAEEITQAVFVILARKAAGLGRSVVLSGWLYQAARLTAANFLKGEIRRQRREQEVYMQSALDEPDAAAWEQIAPLLDEAMGQLGETDRNAVVLRYFENKTAAETAAALRLTEAAAHKRTSRALEKLRRIFTKRGITSAVAIAALMSANSVHAAPAGLAANIAATAVRGTSISATLTMLVKGTMKTMTWLKLKFAAGVGTAVLLVGGVATVAISQTGGEITAQNMTALDIAAKSRDAYAALSSYSDSGTVVYQIGNQAVTTTFNIRLQRPNLYRIEWTQTSGLSTTKGEVWSDGTGDYSLMGDPLGANVTRTDPKLKKMPNMKTALASANGLSGSAAATIPGAFFKQDLDVFIAPVVSGRHPLQKEPDGKVGDVDCYAVSSTLDFSKIPDNNGKPGTASTTLWIGKGDFLIHQTRTKYVEKVDDSTMSDQAIDDAIKKSLQLQNKPATPEAIAAMRPQMQAIMKQVQSTLKAGFESGVVTTQTHENILVNPQLSPADFAR